MIWISVAIIGFLLIYKLRGSRLLEWISLLWLKSIFAIVLLYGAQFIVSNYGLFIPINLFTIGVTTLFGIPGLISIGVIFKFF